jgi:hypothetical protein
MTDDGPEHGALPGHALTDEERGAPTSRRRQLATFAGVVVAIVAAVVGIAYGSDLTDDEPNGPAPTTAPVAAAPAKADADAEPAPGDVAQAALVEAEDARIWKAVSRGTSRSRGVRTVVLDRRDPGGAYTLDDLVALGAATRAGARSEVATLVQPVVVRTGARLAIHEPGLTLRLGGTETSFASIVAWGGSLSLSGSTDRPLTIEGWDPGAGAADTDVTDGRGYLRAHSGRLDVRDARLDHLGFWSGRTGGVASTGTTFDPGHARIRDAELTDDHIGVYLYGTRKVSVTDTRIARSTRDGIEMDRSTGARLTDVTIDRSGLNGLRAHDGSSSLRVVGGRLSDNAGYGATIDGRPRASGPNALGYGVDNAKGLRLTRTTVTGNHSGGLHVSGTSDVVLESLTVAEGRRPLRVVGRSTGTSVAGSTLTSGRGPVVQVEGGAQDVTIAGNTLDGTASGIAVSGSQVDVTDNTISVDTGTAVAVTGARSAGTIEGNTVKGRGNDAFAISSVATGVRVATNTATGWTTTHRVLEWVEHNPFALLWVAILLVPAIGVVFLLKRFRQHRDLRRLTEDTVIAMAKARRRGEPVPGALPVVAPVAAGATAVVRTEALHPPPPAPPSPASSAAPPEVTRSDRLVTRGAMGQFASAEDLAIHAVLQAGTPPERVARTLGVPISVVHDWLRQHAARITP